MGHVHVTLQVCRRLNGRLQDVYDMLVRNLLVRRKFKEASYCAKVSFHITLLHAHGNRFDII